ncbi:MAG: hypothetical protein AAF616_16435, partial [Bacteroidota bacterium]
MIVAQPHDKKNTIEEVFLHLNASEFVVGETVFYSAFVRSEATGKLSDLSKILYFEILDDSNTPIHQAKIGMKGGRGNGDFFLSSELKTGTYQVIAYTRWMKNFKQYFRQPIVVYNPFNVIPEEPSKVNKKEALFFPEGGSLVGGFTNKVAYELTG